ncbi:YHYH domain-containing protein [Candidatus Albibeggiatoa sp. nov. NOAA]|uniref:YHYH domain-containing protein n=1 Tax=Candidatus Albibeggiatoa sp. nov. NOAA TaxID=3162724 RepID=UPI0033041998|nr:YHYH domain-containing protein [Thiotrichaceae bacterium]
MMYRRSHYLCLFLLLISQLVLAHPGRKDASGCHKDSSTGSRHCHNDSSSSTTKPTSTTTNSNNVTQPSTSTDTNTTISQQKPLLSCDILKSCNEINSCDEALYQLQVCKNTNLDTDSDNIPCEEICIIQSSDNESQSTEKNDESVSNNQASLNISLPDFNAAFENGLKAARAQCKNTPETCGIKINDYIQQGKQICIDDPKNCGIDVQANINNQKGSEQEVNTENTQIDLLEKGRQQCINDPISCGIDTESNPDIEAIRQQYARLGKQSCMNNPDSCGLMKLEDIPVCDTKSHIPVLNNQLELYVPILYYFPLPESTTPVKLWTRATLKEPAEFTEGKQWLLINESGFVPK